MWEKGTSSVLVEYHLASMENNMVSLEGGGALVVE